MSLSPELNPYAGQMSRYKIADLILEMDSGRNRLKKQAQPYILPPDDHSSVDLSLRIGDAFFLQKLKENPHLNPDALLYILTCAEFMHSMLRFNGIGLHASAVVYQGNAYLFSANSGVGKSTHTQLWLDYFGRDEAFILNDDKPVIRCLDGVWYAYGTPWSGKTNLNRPVRAPLHGLAFIDRAPRDRIEQVRPEELLFSFMEQIMRPSEEAFLTVTLDRMIALLKAIPVFRLHCTPTLHAVEVAYHAMKNAVPK